jgi:putative ABC transport system substrate-binding protein
MRIFLSSVLILSLAFFYLAEAQTTKSIPRIGYVASTGGPKAAAPGLDAFRRGLSDRGYVEGKNISIEIRYAEGNLGQMPALVKDLVQQNVDVLFAANSVVIQAAKEATKTIPIVMISSIDPVVAGYISSFTRPGGNITGYANMARDISGKRLELITEIIPKASRLAVLWDTDGPGPKIAVKEYETAARALKLQLRSIGIQGPKPDLEKAFLAAKNARTDVLIVVGNPLIGEFRKQIGDLALSNRLPTLTEDERYVRAGGLVSYGANLAELYRGASVYVDAILKGSKPGDLRVKQPDVFELFLNQGTASQLGLTIPKYVLMRANEVIE